MGLSRCAQCRPGKWQHLPSSGAGDQAKATCHLQCRGVGSEPSTLSQGAPSPTVPCRPCPRPCTLGVRWAEVLPPSGDGAAEAPPGATRLHSRQSAVSPALWAIQPAPQPELLGWAWWLGGWGWRAEVPRKISREDSTSGQTALSSPHPSSLGSALP